MESFFGIQGKIALVTGAARGIGAACAEILALAGAKVMVTDVLMDAGEETAASIRKKGGVAKFLKLDVAKEDEWREALSFTVQTFKGLDILVNNAGIEIAKPVHEMNLEEWKRIFSINTEGVFLGTKHATNVMKPGGQGGKGGAIVNISSIAGMVGFPGFSAYCASKGAVRQFSKAAAKEYGGMNIRVNSLHPGVIETAMGERAIKDLADLGFGGDRGPCLEYLLGETPLRRLGRADDIASAVLFLASDLSRFVTGIELVVDGGLIA